MTLIIALIVMAYIMFFFEIILPGGVLAVLGLLTLTAAAALTMQDYGVFAAFGVFVGSIMLAVVLFFLEIKLLEKSPIGGQFKLMTKIEGSSLKKQGDETLIGEEGDTVTPLNPSGRILINNKNYLAKSQSGWLEAGERVKVVESNVFHLIVTKV